MNRANDHSKYKDWIDPNAVVPYERNAKKHDDKQVANIANSIKRFGWQQDTVITNDNVLVIGHGRRLAALKLGCMMPYHRIDKDADQLTEKDIRELRIADNQTNAETGMDFSMLDMEIGDLEFEGFEWDNLAPIGNDGYVDDFFDRGVEAKQKAEVFGVKVMCGTQEQVDECIQLLREQGYSPEQL